MDIRRWFIKYWCVALVLTLVLVCVAAVAKATFNITSSAFKGNGMIPEKYSAYGDNVSPPLKWSNVPAKVKTFALICDDPDAPGGTFVHWVIFNIPADARELKAARPRTVILPDGVVQGTNDVGETGYYGPRPPSGTHRYYFKLYALSSRLDLKSDAKKADLLAAMKGKIIAQTQIMGKYKSPNK